MKKKFNLSWLYFLVLLGIGYLLFNNRQSSEPERWNGPMSRP